ncbi:hypothetical protein IFR05_010370 [Cadophora sp. M221]|nr:hypothetical protein IFR05_010370 [Cadophora sp. M221]
MTRFYTSQLGLIKRLAAEAGIDDDAFNERFMTNLNNVYRHRQTAAVVTFDTVYYLAEKDTWEQIWPRTLFPGTDPRTSYNSFLPTLLQQARKETGMKEVEIHNIWMKCLEDSRESCLHLGMEVVQYEAEKKFWELHWSDIGSFEGQDPRTA